MSENPNSFWITGTAVEITTRSIYVIMYAATVSPRTMCRTRVAFPCGSMRGERGFSAIRGVIVNVASDCTSCDVRIYHGRGGLAKSVVGRLLAAGEDLTHGL